MSEESEASDRFRVRSGARDATDAEWEVFVRETVHGPMCHVGSVTAATPEAAHESAAMLFAVDASGIWLCPATEVVRYSDHALGARAEGSHDTGGPSGGDHGRAPDASNAAGREP